MNELFKIDGLSSKHVCHAFCKTKSDLITLCTYLCSIKLFFFFYNSILLCEAYDVVIYTRSTVWAVRFINWKSGTRTNIKGLERYEGLGMEKKKESRIYVTILKLVVQQNLISNSLYPRLGTHYVCSGVQVRERRLRCASKRVDSWVKH